MIWYAALFYWLTLTPPQGDFVVITARKTPVETLSAYQLKQIYYGKLDRIGGIHIVPLHLRKHDPLRHSFEARYLGSQADLEDYWLRQKLKGDARPPLEVGDWALVLAYVRRNPGFIGYIPADRLDQLPKDEIRVVTISP